MGLYQFCAMIFLLGEMCDIAVGVDDFTVQFEDQKTCFAENTDIALVVKYTGAGTPDILRWKFSKMTTAYTLNIAIGFCLASAGADPAFPVGRMSYTCNDTLKKYTTTITSFSEATDAGKWEVALSVNGTFTNFKSVTVAKCSAPPEEIYDCPGLGNSTYVDSDGECACAWLGICLCTLISFGLILGYILIKYAKHYCCDECCEECLECCCCWCCSACCFIATLSAWYQILWVSVVFTPVAIGIWVVLKCLKIIEPDMPVITKKFSPNATSICVEWMKSNDGGSQILFYRITILRVTVKGNTEIEEVVEVKKINNILSTSCTFTELSPGTTYKVKVCAHNVMFRSLPGQEVIHTKNGKSDKDDTSRDVESTRSSPKHANSKLLNEKKQNSATGKAEGVNKGKHVSDTQIQDKDKSQKVHSEKNFRPQPQPPPGANINHREGSGSVVSGRDVEMQETDTLIKKSQLPNMHSPGHDKKGRGLSANFGDDGHPLVAIDTPAQKAGTLPTLEDTRRETKKKTKKKKKDKQEDNQNTETVLDF